MWPKISEIVAESESPKLKFETQPKVETLAESRNSGRNYLASAIDFWPAL
jgi:hypothetical protein